MQYLKKAMGWTSPVEQEPAGDKGSAAAAAESRRTSNKQDSSPALGTADIHRVNVHYTKKEANQLCENVSSQAAAPSVKDFIEQAKRPQGEGGPTGEGRDSTRMAAAKEPAGAEPEQAAASSSPAAAHCTDAEGRSLKSSPAAAAAGSPGHSSDSEESARLKDMAESEKMRDLMFCFECN